MDTSLEIAQRRLRVAPQDWSAPEGRLQLLVRLYESSKPETLFAPVSDESLVVRLRREAVHDLIRDVINEGGNGLTWRDFVAGLITRTVFRPSQDLDVNSSISTTHSTTTGSKTLALFFDGTWNGPEEVDASLVSRMSKLTRQGLTSLASWLLKKKQESDDEAITLSPATNVLKLMRAVLADPTTAIATCAQCQRPASLASGNPQVSLYFEGIGTDTSPISRAIEGAFGYGIDRDIQQAYRFIVQNYRHKKDNLYLFGFSRGAFTARALAGFLDVFGIIPPREMRRLPELYLKYMDLAEQGGREKAEAFAKDVLHGEKMEVTIEFLGVWDSVKALRRPNMNQTFAHQVELPHNITYAYQALALDEVRKEFVPVLWTKIPPGAQKVEQVWFAGAHSDVGGGYEEAGLSNVALRWMACRALDAGLALDVEYLRRLADPRSLHHDSHQLKTVLWGAPTLRKLLLADYGADAAGFWSTIGLHEDALRSPTLTASLYGYADLTGFQPDQDPRLLDALRKTHERRADLRAELDPSGPGIVRDDCRW
jgi:hypothetical protein